MSAVGHSERSGVEEPRYATLKITLWGPSTSLRMTGLFSTYKMASAVYQLLIWRCVLVIPRLAERAEGPHPRCLIRPAVRSVIRQLKGGPHSLRSVQALFSRLRWLGMTALA